MAEDHKRGAAQTDPGDGFVRRLHYRLEPGVSFMVYRHSLMSHNPIHTILSSAGCSPTRLCRLAGALSIR